MGGVQWSSGRLCGGPRLRAVAVGKDRADGRGGYDHAELFDLRADPMTTTIPQERFTLLTAARALGRALDYDTLLVAAFLGPEQPFVLHTDRSPDPAEL